MQIFNTSDFVGNGRNNFFTGVVEDNADPLTLLRVKVRIHVYHTEDKSQLPTTALPWAIVMQPTTNSAMSGIGTSSPLQLGTWVFGMFLDELYQQPMVIGTLPGIHRPQAPGAAGNTDGGYLNNNPMGTYGGTPPYHGQGLNSDGKNLPNDTGNTLRDNGQYITDSDKGSWPLKYYTSAKVSAGGVACNGTGTNRIHKSSALALEELVKQYGKGKLRLNSAYRSPQYNASVGGAKNSQHIHGRAFDVSYSGIGTSKAEKIRFAQMAAKNGFVGFGLYGSFMHIDTGTGRIWYQGGDLSQSELAAALNKVGWAPGKKGLLGTKIDTSANTNPSTSNTSTTTSNNVSSTSDGKTVKDSQTKSVQDRITEKYKAAGYSDAAIAAVKASASSESSFDPTRVNRGDARDGTDSVGLFQWNQERLAGLKAFAAERGTSYTDVDTQIDYSIKELGPGGARSSAGSALRSSTTTSEANAAMARYEGYAGWNNPNSAEYIKRANLTNSIYNGSVPPEKRSMPGFHDPTNSLPYAAYKGKPSTNEAVRGLNANIYHANHQMTETGKMTGLPIAGNKGTFGEPENSYAPQYPHNNQWSTKGHSLELDDTPGAERIQLTHKAGSTIIMTAKGSKTERVVGNSYKMDSRDSFHGIQGDYYLTSVGDMNVRSTTDITIQSDGSKTEMVYNDQSTIVSGNFDVLIGETLQIKTNRVIIEANDIDIYAKGNLSMQAEGDINLKGKNINIEAASGFNAKAQESKITSSGDTSIKGSTVYMDDIIRLAQGSAKDAPSVKDAKSADLGKAPGRKTIKKNAQPLEHPDTYTTTEEAIGVYNT